MNKGKLTTFILSSIVAPITYISIRFQLFSKKTSISLWALLVIIIILVGAGVLVKYYVDGMKTKYSMTKQILQGVIKVILPIGIVLAFVCFSKYNTQVVVEQLNKFIEALIVILVCEGVAIVVNPFPKWCFENNIDGLAEITDKIFSKKEENK